MERALLERVTGERWLRTRTRGATGSFAKFRPDPFKLFGSVNMPPVAKMKRTDEWNRRNFTTLQGQIRPAMDLIDEHSTLHNAERACEVCGQLSPTP